MEMQVKNHFETWLIVRSKPAPKANGRSISLLINNVQCHLTTVDVYEDGSIDCWGFVDRELFKNKVEARWSCQVRKLVSICQCTTLAPQRWRMAVGFRLPKALSSKWSQLYGR